MADMVAVAGAFMDAAAESAGAEEYGCHQTCACLVGLCANYTYGQMSKVAALRKTTIQAVADPLGFDQAQRLGRRLWSDAPESVRDQAEALVHDAEEGCYETGVRCGSLLSCACGMCEGSHEGGLYDKALVNSLTELSKQRRKEKSCSPSSSSSALG